MVSDYKGLDISALVKEFAGADFKMQPYQRGILRALDGFTSTNAKVAKVPNGFSTFDLKNAENAICGQKADVMIIDDPLVAVTKRELTAPRIVETTAALEEDFSQCRSPARAKRRKKKGHPQRIRLVPSSYRVGNTLFIHPEMARQIKDAAAASLEKSVDRMLFDTFMGVPIYRSWL